MRRQSHIDILRTDAGVYIIDKMNIETYIENINAVNQTQCKCVDTDVSKYVVT